MEVKKICIEREGLDTIDMYDVLPEEGKRQKNRKGKTYGYVALLSDYVSAHEMKREFIHGAKVDARRFNVEVDLSVIHVGVIMEVKLNLKDSRNYSRVFLSYFVVESITNDKVVGVVLNTAYRAFKYRDQQMRRDVSKELGAKPIFLN